MEKIGFLARKAAGRIEVHLDRSRTEALRLFVDDADGGLCFGFKAHVNSGTFKNYSEAFLSIPDALPYFENSGGVREGERIRLHPGKEVSAKDMRPLDSEPLSGLLDPRDRIVRPAFAVSIRYPAGNGDGVEERLAAAPARYFLRFGARQSYWAYYLLGSFAKKEVSIVDLDGGMGFESLGETVLSDGRPALAFRSKQAMSLGQHSTFRFQLREAGSSNGKILIKRLPVAAAGQVSRQTIRGKVVSVSEVYVNG